MTNTKASPFKTARYTFPIHHMKLPLVAATIGWAVEDWEETASSAEPDCTVVKAELARDSMGLQELCWLLSHLPGCIEASERVAEARAYTGEAQRQAQSIKATPSNEQLHRCMDGLEHYLRTLQTQREQVEFATALLQYGIDINEAVEQGEPELAARIEQQSRIARACLAKVEQLKRR